MQHLAVVFPRCVDDRAPGAAVAAREGARPRRLGPSRRLPRARRDARAVDSAPSRREVDVRELLASGAARHLERSPTGTPTNGSSPRPTSGSCRRDVDPEIPDDTTWHPVEHLPRMAFDHGEIVLAGRERLRAKLSYMNLGFALAPPDLHDPGAARPVHRGARARGLGDEPPARPRPPRAARGHRRAALPGPHGGRPATRRRASTRRSSAITDQFAVLRPPG